MGSHVHVIGSLGWWCPHILTPTPSHTHTHTHSLTHIHTHTLPHTHTHTHIHTVCRAHLGLVNEQLESASIVAHGIHALCRLLRKFQPECKSPEQPCEWQSHNTERKKVMHTHTHTRTRTRTRTHMRAYRSSWQCAHLCVSKVLGDVLNGGAAVFTPEGAKEQLWVHRRCSHHGTIDACQAANLVCFESTNAKVKAQSK